MFIQLNSIIIHFLLFWHLASGSTSLVNNNKNISKNVVCDVENILSNGIAKIIAEICTKDEITGNLIYSRDHEKIMCILNEITRKVSATMKVLVRIESTDYLNYSSIKLKSCNVLMITSFDDFMKIYKIITPQLFNYRQHFLIVIVTSEHANASNIEIIFQLLWKKFIFNVNIVTINDDLKCFMSVTTFYPFRANACNNTTPIVVNKFENGKFEKSLEHFSKDKLKDLHQCPVRVVTGFGSEPFIYVRKIANGTKLFELSGRDVTFMDELSKILNFRAEYIVLDDKGYLFENGSADGLFKLLMNGSAELAVCDLWITKIRMKFFDMSTPYISEDLIFVIPPPASFSSIENLIYPLTPCVWIALLSFISTAYFIIFLIQFQSNEIRDIFIGNEIKNPYLNVFIVLLGNVQHKLPKKNFSRFIFTMFLLFSLIIRTAYQGSMYQFIQSERKYKDPQTIDELISKNYNFHILKLSLELFTHFDASYKR